MNPAAKTAQVASNAAVLSYRGKKRPAMVTDITAYAAESNHSTKLPIAVAASTFRCVDGVHFTTSVLFPCFSVVTGGPLSARAPVWSARTLARCVHHGLEVRIGESYRSRSSAV